MASESFTSLIAQAPKHFQNSLFQQRDAAESSARHQRDIVAMQEKGARDRLLLGAELNAIQRDKDNRWAAKWALLSAPLTGLASLASGSRGRFAGGDQFMQAYQQLNPGPSATLAEFNSTVGQLNDFRGGMGPWLGLPTGLGALGTFMPSAQSSS